MNLRLFGFLAAFLVLLMPGALAANGRADYIPGLDPALRIHIQKRLKEEGFYRGTLDGRFGPASQKAVADFRRAKHLIESNDYVDEGGVVVRGDPLTLYLTPKLIKSLLGIEYETDGEISREQQRELLRLIRRGPRRAPGPGD